MGVNLRRGGHVFGLSEQVTLFGEYLTMAESQVREKAEFSLCSVVLTDQPHAQALR